MEKVLREVAKELLEETDLLKDRGFLAVMSYVTAQNIEVSMHSKLKY